MRIYYQSAYRNIEKKNKVTSNLIVLFQTSHI